MTQGCIGAVADPDSIRPPLADPKNAAPAAQIGAGPKEPFQTQPPTSWPPPTARKRVDSPDDDNDDEQGANVRLNDRPGR